ncbi:MAG TPA: protein kinase, partial [Vicinamibacterales bacterium]
MTGQTIGKYRILERLGSGGMGTVYKAFDETLERDVAIKVLNRGVTEPEILKRFRAEAATLAKLNHPAITTIYDLFEHGDELLIVLEFV